MKSQTVLDFFKPKDRRGRPKKRKNCGRHPAIVTHRSLIRSAAIEKKKKIVDKSRHVKMKVTRTNWSKGKNLSLLQKAKRDWDTKTGDCKAGMSIRKFSKISQIPFGTLANYLNSNIDKRRIICSHVGCKSFLTGDEKLFITDVIRRYDRGNDGIGRQRIIGMIQELKPHLTCKQASHVWEYLHSNSKDKLTGNVVAQKTTTKRSAITINLLHRWHTLVSDTIHEMRKRNIPDGTGVKWDDVKHFFFLNFDEECLIANARGMIIVGEKGRRKHEKIANDSRVSITVARVGSAAGSVGPTSFLLKGVRRRAGYTDSFLRRHGAVEGSTIVMTENAFLTDAAWLQLVPHLAKGIRSMPVIRDHPTWWVFLALDGYLTHVRLWQALDIFYNHKILLLKEEGDSSHVYSSYVKNIFPQRGVS